MTANWWKPGVWRYRLRVARRATEETTFASLGNIEDLIDDDDY